MLIAGIIGLCVLLAVAAFLFPRLSRHAHSGSDKGLELGQRGAGKAPGPLGRWFSKPFGKSRKAASKSDSAGRRARDKMPF